MATSDKLVSAVAGSTLYETFFQKTIGDDYYETIYARDMCIEHFKYRILVVGKKCLFITDDPPKNLENRIEYSDIVDIQVVRYNFS